MKIFEIIWKEISLVKAQKIAILLILLYPLLAIGLLGSAFSGIDVTKIQQVKVGFVNELGFESSEIENFSKSNDLSIIRFSDENSLIDAIKQKSVIVGLKVSGKSQTSQIRVDLFYDNSNLLSSRFFMEIAKAVMQKITFNIAQSKLSDVWSTISSLGDNISAERENVDLFKSQLNAAGESLVDLEKKLSDLDINSIKKTLKDQESSVNNYSADVESFSKSISSYKSSFNETKKEYNSFKQSILSHENKLAILPSKIDEVLVSLNSVKKGLLDLSPALPPDEKAAVEGYVVQISQAESEISSWGPVVDDFLTLMSEIKDESSKINKAFLDADKIFDKLDDQASLIDSTLSNSSSAIRRVNSELKVFEDSINQINLLINDSKKSKENIEEKLNSSSEILSSFSDQVISFNKIDPKVLAQPVVFYERKVFDVDPFGILVSNATIVVLILTCLLLTSIIIILERTENVSLRLKLAPTNRFVLFLGKVLGQMIIAFIEALIIFAVAFIKIPLPFSIFGLTQIGFGLVTSASIFDLFLAVMIISFVFICLGLLISVFAKNQSTAILTSLLIIVPMLFLSGVILPIEFMEPTMQIVSAILPMTLANNLLIGLIIKGMSIFELWFEIGFLLFYSLMVIAVLIIKKEY